MDSSRGTFLDHVTASLSRSFASNLKIMIHLEVAWGWRTDGGSCSGLCECWGDLSYGLQVVSFVEQKPPLPGFCLFGFLKRHARFRKGTHSSAWGHVATHPAVGRDSAPAACAQAWGGAGRSTKKRPNAPSRGRPHLPSRPAPPLPEAALGMVDAGQTGPGAEVRL